MAVKVETGYLPWGIIKARANSWRAAYGASGAKVHDMQGRPGFNPGFLHYWPRNICARRSMFA
jgi:hypothetical protein